MSAIWVGTSKFISAITANKLSIEKLVSLAKFINIHIVPGSVRRKAEGI
jgi:hypothetical protein